MSISVSENQYLSIVHAAFALHPGDRDRFYAAVATGLRGRPIGDGVVARVVAEQFRALFHPPEETTSLSRWDRHRPNFEKASRRAY